MKELTYIENGRFEVSEKVKPAVVEATDAVVGEIVEAMYRLSVSGVQEKFPAIIENGKIRIAQDGERFTHILKPAPWDKTLRDRKQIPANEHLTMQIASQVYGIQTASNGLCFTPDGLAVYITRRFDILPDDNKMPMEDFASLVGKNEKVFGTQFKYNGSYEDIAKAIRSNVAAWICQRTHQSLHPHLRVT